MDEIIKDELLKRFQNWLYKDQYSPDDVDLYIRSFVDIISSSYGRVQTLHKDSIDILWPRFKAIMDGYATNIFKGVLENKEEQNISFSKASSNRQRIASIEQASIFVESELKPKIPINSAEAKELRDIPGIGYVISSEIVAYRKRFGKFKDVDDLKKITTITSQLFNKIKPYIYINSNASSKESVSKNIFNSKKSLDFPDYLRMIINTKSNQIGKKDIESVTSTILEESTFQILKNHIGKVIDLMTIGI